MKEEDNNKLDMKNQSSINANTGRRKLLKAVVAGGGAATVAKVMPEQWARPVVDSVMLPSHAQTSVSAFGAFGGSGVVAQAATDTQMAEQGFSDELLEFFTPAAHATVGNVAVDISLTASESGSSYICASDGIRSEYIPIDIVNGSFINFSCMLGYFVIAYGLFTESLVWSVDVRNELTNVTTSIDLVSGGLGCDFRAFDPSVCVE